MITHKIVIHVWVWVTEQSVALCSCKGNIQMSGTSLKDVSGREGKKNSPELPDFFHQMCRHPAREGKTNQSEDDCQMNSVADGTICID
jgi:hypothetical protein